MQIIRNGESLEGCLARAAAVGKDKPVVLTKLVEQAREIEVDAVFSKGELIASVVGEHVEDAGVHSGDATLVIPSSHTEPGSPAQCAQRIVRIDWQGAKHLGNLQHTTSWSRMVGSV